MNWLVEFIFPHRLHRIAFLLRLIASDIVPAFLFFIDLETHSGLFYGLDVVLLIYSIFFIVLPRIRDVGISGWWLIVLFIPIANTLLAFVLFFVRPNIPFQNPFRTH